MFVALDIGTVRIGCATADEEVRIPFPRAVWPAAQKRAETAILKLLAENSVSSLVVGLPLDDNGMETKQCEIIRQFCTRLSKRTTVPIVFVDEADSSEEAKELLRDAGAELDMLDAYAACCILSRYLANSTPGTGCY